MKHPLKLLSKLLLMVFIGSCTNEKPNQIYIESFNETFGVEDTEGIDEIIKYGDNLLLKAYDQVEIEEAYKLFLNQIKKGLIDSIDIGLTIEEMEGFINQFEKNDLKNKIWSFSERDGREVFDLAYDGAFLTTFQKLQMKDSIAFNYWGAYRVAGGISYSLLATGVLNYDMNNYLVKRIVIIDILYRNLTITTYTRGKRKCAERAKLFTQIVCK